MTYEYRLFAFESREPTSEEPIPSPRYADGLQQLNELAAEGWRVAAPLIAPETSVTLLEKGGWGTDSHEIGGFRVDYVVPFTKGLLLEREIA
jgi:hypothetical protein